MLSSMQSRYFHRLMSRLALIAALLLLLAPTTGRLLSSPAQSNGVWAQLCTMSGLQLVKLPPGAVDPDPSRPAGSSMDCEYCPLLLAATALVLSLLLVLRQPSERLVPAQRTPPRHDRGHPCGLGSRGPPIAL